MGVEKQERGRKCDACLARPGKKARSFDEKRWHMTVNTFVVTAW